MFDLTEKEKKIFLAIIGLILAGWFLNFLYQKTLQAPVIISSENHLSKNKNTATSNSTLIVIDVGGAVNKPGIYKLKDGSRVYEALKKAGGEKENADTSKLNLAAKLQDGGENCSAC